MVPRLSLHPETGARESDILNRLLGLYEEERQLYLRVKELTSRQEDEIRRGAPLADIRQILEKKKACLEVVGRLEMAEGNAKAIWARNREDYSSLSRARLQEAVQNVGDIIEDILEAEEQCDMYLIEQSRGV